MTRMLKKQWTALISLSLIAILIASCSALTHPMPGTPAINQMKQALQTGIANNDAMNTKNNTLPSSVTNALVPDMSVLPNQSKPQDNRFDIAVSNVPANQFFLSLMKNAKLNIVVSPKITGAITLNLHHVTTENVLNALHDIYGYQFEKTTYGYKIMPGGLQTRIFTVNYLNVIRKGKSNTDISSGQISQNVNKNKNSSSTNNSSSSTTKNTKPSSSVETSSESSFWNDLKVTLNAIIGDSDGRKVVINPDAGLIVVKADPAELKQAATYLDSVQANMTRQVIIDAKILEVQLSHGYQAGIDWTLFGANIKQESTANTFENIATKTLTGSLAPFTNMFSLDMHSRGNSFSMLINLLSDQGNVQILSSPRISTMNNQKAVIKVGQDEFFVTNVSSTSIATSTNPQNTQDIDLTPFFSGIALDVTPEISSDHEVILHIHPIVSSVTDQNKKFEVSGAKQDLPLALSTIRESDSIVKAKSGQIIVIGGLMENRTLEDNASTPGLDKVPYVAPLFKRTKQTSVKTELVILLRPIVVGSGTWSKQLKKDAEGLRKINEGFHFGAHPKVFGNLGEPAIQNKLKQQKGKAQYH
jgi:MSHA biogenesis protein MshL